MPKYFAAIVQMKSTEDKKNNLKESLRYIEEAAKGKASLICFPEFQMAYSPPSQTAEQLSEIAESATNGNFIKNLQRSAKKNNIAVLATIYERTSVSSKESKVHDTAVFMDSKGSISRIYRKLHLYDALGFKESKKLLAGNKIERPVRTPAGVIGLLICYDLRFPEHSRILTVNGSDILAAPSAWVNGIMKEEHWQTMVKARAMENGSYVIAPDQLGNMYCGRSMVVDPFGTVIVDMGNREGVEVVEINKNRIAEVRNSLPLLKNRRTDIYGQNLDAFT